MVEKIGGLLFIAIFLTVLVNGIAGDAKIGQLLLTLVALVVIGLASVIWLVFSRGAEEKERSARAVQAYEDRIAATREQNRLQQAQREAQELAARQQIEQENKQKQREREAAAKRQPGREALRNAVLQNVLSELNRRS